MSDLNRMLSGLSWEERARMESGKPIDGAEWGTVWGDGNDGAESDNETDAPISFASAGLLTNWHTCQTGRDGRCWRCEREAGAL